LAHLPYKELHAIERFLNRVTYGELHVGNFENSIAYSELHHLWQLESPTFARAREKFAPPYISPNLEQNFLSDRF
jgi:hypothetical protein